MGYLWVPGGEAILLAQLHLIPGGLPTTSEKPPLANTSGNARCQCSNPCLVLTTLIASRTPSGAAPSERAWTVKVVIAGIPGRSGQKNAAHQASAIKRNRAISSDVSNAR